MEHTGHTEHTDDATGAGGEYLPLPDKKLTPLFKQYLAIKREHPDAVMLYRLGDFYEMFGPDAERAAKILSVVLTSRQASKGVRVPMCGIPHHAMMRYVKKLVDAGEKVAVCDQMEEPGPGKKLVHRAVTRIIIPSLGLDTVVKYVPFDGSTWLIGGLKQEVAWMGDTSWPGLGGNTGLAGHVDLADGSDGPFRFLFDLQPGDEVILHTEQNIYTYLVREQVVVEDYDLSVIEATEKPQITLITCTDWDTELRVYLKRLVIFSDLIDVKPF